MPDPLRSSFSARLLCAGVTLSFTLVAGIGGLLLLSAATQARSAALTTAGNRATVVDRLLERITGPVIDAEATGVASVLSQDAQAGAPLLRRAVATLLAGPAGPYGETAVLVTPDLRAVTSPQRPVPLTAVSPAVRAALTGGTAQGAEAIAGGPGFVAAAPIRADRTVIGAAVEVQPLAAELSRFAGVIGFPTLVVDAGHPQVMSRLGENATAVMEPSPDAIASGVRAHRATVAAVYTDRGGAAVAGSLVPLRSASGQTVAYLGAEVPLSVFTADARAAEITVVLVSVFAVLVTATGVLLFVERFVRRPVLRLERGVARIAGGDYASDIPVTSPDELGRLAQGVNRMRAEIARSIDQIERDRARLDGAVEQLGGVSKALTSTAGGVAALHEAVVGAAAAIGGPGAAAMLLIREDDRLELQATHGTGGALHEPPLREAMERLVEGEQVRGDRTRPGEALPSILAPMLLRGAAVGALAVIQTPGQTPAEDQERSLAVLASHAAIALENARLLEQERETVRRLSRLDAMKSEFLGTVQHELRTPLTTILGMSDMLELYSASLDDRRRTEALHDIRREALRLQYIVETILDFSLLGSDTLPLDRRPTAVRSAAERAVAAVVARHPGDPRVPVLLEVPAGVEVDADRPRLTQALEALVDNALKFTREGGRVWVRARRTGDGTVRIEVADTGDGIPEEALPHVFDPFFQADGSATRAHGGMGMGLALVRRLVEAHGGTVEVESRVGAGTRVVLALPPHRREGA